MVGLTLPLFGIVTLVDIVIKLEQGERDDENGQIVSSSKAAMVSYYQVYQYSRKRIEWGMELETNENTCLEKQRKSKLFR